MQVETLDVQDNSARVQDVQEKEFLYPKNSLVCEVVVALEESTSSAIVVILYEEELLELTGCVPVAGATADTSVAGVVKLTVNQSIGSGETVLCSLHFSVRTAATGTAYVTVAPESSLTNSKGTFAFSECAGVLTDVCLPDYNGDCFVDLRDFTFLAKQHGISVDESTAKYDVVEDGVIDDADLDYMTELLFAGVAQADKVEAVRVADRTLQAAYTITSTIETRVTTYEYNAADQLIKVTDCNGNSVCYEYDACGRMVKMTDQAGYITEILYDTAGNPVKVVLPEGVTESYTYDTNGSVLTVTDALGATVTYGYDVYGRTVSITDADGVKTEYQYDIVGNVVKNLFTGETYCYNAYDEVVSYTDAEGNVTRVSYDALGNVTNTVDALGNVTEYTYRKDGLLTEIKDASGAVTLYEYNNKGLVSKETDVLGAVTTYEYDNENRPVKVTTPDGTVTEYAYNSDGSITRVTATKTSGESEELRYLYNLDGTLAASISSTDILEYVYNSRGSVASVTKNNTHQVKLSYDGNGNMTRLEELTEGVTESVTSYNYDAKGQLTKVSNAEGLLASYISRADGLLEQVTDGAGNVTKYQYNQQKQVIGLTITAADGSVLYSETNTYNKNGSLVSQNIGGTGYEAESRSYSYDALDRLLSETNNGVTTNYTYDSMGNRLTKTSDDITTSYTYDICNKLLTETTGEEEITYSYDVLGNLAAKVSSEGRTNTYAYDALNQLTEVVNQDGTWQTNTYDASGIRSMITENGVTTEFMAFSGLVLSGYDKNGEQTEHYYYGNSLLAMEQNISNTETSLYYYIKNSHGDVIGLTDTYSTLTETYRYDAFGTLISIQSLNENGVLAEIETALSRFLYAGEQYDAVTSLYYLRARQYDTEIGRFTQEDTYLGDGRNLYVYVSNNPLKYVDPSGYCSKNVGCNDADRINDLYLDMVAGADPEAYMQYQEEHKAWYDAWNFAENTTEYVVSEAITNSVEVIGAKVDFASGYVDGIWSGFTQTLPNGKSYFVSEQAYDKGLVMGNLTVYAADTGATFISGLGTCASATASVVATVGGGYAIVPGAVAATAFCAESTSFLVGKAKKTSERLSDSVEELLDQDESDSNSEHMLGANGTQVSSKTTWQNGKTERIDVENPAPGERPGQVHYHDSNNNKYYYDIDNNAFYDQKTGELAPKSIQKLLEDKEFTKGIKKALQILGE